MSRRLQICAGDTVSSMLGRRVNDWSRGSLRARRVGAARRVRTRRVGRRHGRGDCGLRRAGLHPDGPHHPFVEPPRELSRHRHQSASGLGHRARIAGRGDLRGRRFKPGIPDRRALHPPCKVHRVQTYVQLNHARVGSCSQINDDGDWTCTLNDPRLSGPEDMRRIHIETDRSSADATAGRCRRVAPTSGSRDSFSGTPGTPRPAGTTTPGGRSTRSQHGDAPGSGGGPWPSRSCPEWSRARPMTTHPMRRNRRRSPSPRWISRWTSRPRLADLTYADG